ncbi:MAG: hypothetical protein U9Q98_05955 [Bacteroidota bacterium]|nr:hypothetical protein [Bacteroidota bacterium]
MKNKTILILIIVLVIMSLYSCAPSGTVPKEAGFFAGLWHGFIIIFSLIGKLFGADIGIYAANNSGFFYWLGFIIGIGGFGGGGFATRR